MRDYPNPVPDCSPIDSANLGLSCYIFFLTLSDSHTFESHSLLFTFSQGLCRISLLFVFLIASCITLETHRIILKQDVVVPNALSLCASVTLLTCFMLFQYDSDSGFSIIFCVFQLYYASQGLSTFISFTFHFLGGGHPGEYFRRDRELCYHC